ncbi:MAG: peptidase S41 [Planctomycetes bacterium]|nr:peptidase S41 [Planctomycetota bacterium]
MTRMDQEGSLTRGAVPYKPTLTHSEALAEIEKAIGKPRSLQKLRDALPIAAHGRPARALAEAVRGAKPKLKAAATTPADAAVGGVPALTTAQRLVLIDQAKLLLQEVYAHLPLKRAMHAIDPIQSLQLLRLRHEGLNEREFQSELLEVFVSLRDLHTNYFLPKAYFQRVAYLPFRVEEYYVDKQRRYLVSWVAPENREPKLKAGVEVTHWNGMPIDLAVARNAAREAGSNTEARRARGLEALTLRWFGTSLPPDEDWVTLTFLDGGQTAETRHEWNVVSPSTPIIGNIFAAGSGGASGAGLGLDFKTEVLRRVRKALFDAPALQAEAEMAKLRASRSAPRADASRLPDVFPRFGTVATPSGEFGYVRLATFAPPGNDADKAVNDAVDEFVRILRTLPATGLVLDLRGNGGGYINFGERILQTLTPRTIMPEPFHFLTTAFTLRLSESVPWLEAWAVPLATALSTGAGHSQGFPLTEPGTCNAIGQVYQGPVVLVTDAFCYSTTDIFAAGFQDHEIGTILGCHNNTGAGGANVWDHAALRQIVPGPQNPFVALPGGAGMRVAIRRSTRVGARSGVPLEDLGVVPDERHFMTRDDLLEHNTDLIAHAGRLLAGKRSHSLQMGRLGAVSVTGLILTARNIDRVDLMVNDRPVLSHNQTGGVMEVQLPKPAPSGTLISAQGFENGVLVSSVRLRV